MENNVNKPVVKTEQNNIYRPKRPKRFVVKPKFSFNFDERFWWNALNMLVSGLLGGIAFSVGTTAYLSVNNKSVGSAIFTLGMIIIFSYGFGFYTSKIGFAVKNSTEQNLMLIPIWLGNLLGSLLVGGILSLTRTSISETLYSRANQLCGATLSDSVGGILILSVLCGFLMFIATDNYKNAKNVAQKYIVLFLISMVFLLCEFEHFASSAFLFTMAGVLNIKAFWYLLLMTLGNSIGALIIPLAHSGVKLIQKKAKQQ